MYGCWCDDVQPYKDTCPDGRLVLPLRVQMVFCVCMSSEDVRSMSAGVSEGHSRPRPVLHTANAALEVDGQRVVREGCSLAATRLS